MNSNSIESVLDSNSRELLDNQSKKIPVFNDDTFDFLNDASRTIASDASRAARTKISAETLRVLSSANLNDLDFKSRFELLFNDLAMLKSSAVQDILSKSCLRIIAWMVFLECLPFDKSKWCERISSNRKEYEALKIEIFRDPRQSQFVDDHPLSSDRNSSWNKYFQRSKLKELINQDVIRMYDF